MTINEKVREEIQKYITNLDALNYILLYVEYANLIDDQIDEVQNDWRTNRVAHLAAVIYNCPYWQKYNHVLKLIERVVHSNFITSQSFKNDNQTARFLASGSVDMIVAVSIIECDFEKANELNLFLRNAVKEMHKEDE